MTSTPGRVAWSSTPGTGPASGQLPSTVGRRWPPSMSDGDPKNGSGLPAFRGTRPPAARSTGAWLTDPRSAERTLGPAHPRSAERTPGGAVRVADGQAQPDAWGAGLGLRAPTHPDPGPEPPIRARSARQREPGLRAVLRRPGPRDHAPWPRSPPSRPRPRWSGRRVSRASGSSRSTRSSNSTRDAAWRPTTRSGCSTSSPARHPPRGGHRGLKVARAGRAGIGYVALGSTVSRPPVTGRSTSKCRRSRVTMVRVR